MADIEGKHTVLVWGSSSTALAQQVSVEGLCSACGHKEFVLHGIQRYSHIWWIPFFPSDRVFFLTCLNCESTLSNKSVESLVKDINPSIFKTPKRTYAGIFILISVILMIYIFDR